MPAMPVIFCCTGCGFIGHANEFTKDDIFRMCPSCYQNHIFQVTNENMSELIGETVREFVRKLVNNDESFIGIANCGCVYHAEERILCKHDVARAREMHSAHQTISPELEEAVMRTLYHHPRVTPEIVRLLTGKVFEVSPPPPTEEEKVKASSIVEELVRIHYSALRAASLEVTGEDLDEC